MNQDKTVVFLLRITATPTLVKYSTETNAEKIKVKWKKKIQKRNWYYMGEWETCLLLMNRKARDSLQNLSIKATITKSGIGIRIQKRERDEETKETFCRFEHPTTKRTNYNTSNGMKRLLFLFHRELLAEMLWIHSTCILYELNVELHWWVRRVLEMEMAPKYKSIWSTIVNVSNKKIWTESQQRIKSDNTIQNAIQYLK